MEFYTDGAASNNKTRCGGWGMVVKNHDNPQLCTCLSGGEKDTTSNKMELTAFLEALVYINDHRNEPDFQDNIIFTDSAYISNCFINKWYVNWMKNGWINSKREPVKNKDLWEKIFSLYFSSGLKVQVQKVKGHSVNQYNNRADFLAVESRKEIENENSNCMSN